MRRVKDLELIGLEVNGIHANEWKGQSPRVFALKQRQ